MGNFLILFFVLTIVIIVLLQLVKSVSESKLDKINKLIKEKHYDKAKLLIDKLMRTNSKDFLFHWYNAKINYHLKNYEQALKSLKTISKNPMVYKELQEFQFHLLLADVFFALDKPNSAINEYLLVTQYRPDCSRAYAQVGKLFFIQRDNDNALKFLFQAVKIDERDFQSYFLMGRIYYYMELYERSKECFKESMKINKKFYKPYYYLAHIEYNFKRYTNAIQYAGNELKKEGSDKWHKLIFLTGKCYEEMKNYKHAVKFYEMLHNEISTEHPFIKDIYYHLARSYEKDNQIDEAADLWEKLYYIDPKYKDVDKKHAQFSDIENESIVKQILKGNEEELKKIYNNILEKLSLEAEEINFLYDYLARVTAHETSAVYSYNVLVYFNRSLTMVTPGIIKDFLNEIRSRNYRKGYYIVLTDFTNETFNYAEKYPIDLISRRDLVKLVSE